MMDWNVRLLKTFYNDDIYYIYIFISINLSIKTKNSLIRSLKYFLQKRYIKKMLKTITYIRFTIILTIAYENTAIKIQMRAHISSLFASFIFAASHDAVMSFIHQKINTPIQMAHIENRRYLLIVCIVSKSVDSSACTCVGPVTTTSLWPWLEGTSTTMAKVEKRQVRPSIVKTVPYKKFFIIMT